MKLIVSELYTSLYQNITSTEPMFPVAIRPHLLIYGSPAGTVKVQIQDLEGRVVTESDEVVITSLKTLAHGHGYYKFDLDSNFVDEGTYRIAVVAGGGYAFSESAYVGVCHDWDNTKSELGYTPTTDFEKPLDIEIWFRRVT